MPLPHTGSPTPVTARCQRKRFVSGAPQRAPRTRAPGAQHEGCHCDQRHEGRRSTVYSFGAGDRIPRPRCDDMHRIEDGGACAVAAGAGVSPIAGAVIVRVAAVRLNGLPRARPGMRGWQGTPRRCSTRRRARYGAESEPGCAGLVCFGCAAAAACWTGSSSQPGSQHRPL